MKIIRIIKRKLGNIVLEFFNQYYNFGLQKERNNI